MRLSLFRGRRIESSLSISTAVLLVLVLSVTMIVVERRVKENMRDDLERRGVAIARSIAAVATPSLFAYNYSALQMTAEGAAGDQGVVYVAIYDKEGALAGEAGRLPEGSPLRLSSVSDPRGVREVEVQGEGDGRRHERVVEVAVPVRVEGVSEAWGRVRVGLSYEIVASELRELRAQLIVTGLLLAVLALIVVRLLTRNIMAPLRRLAEGTERLAAGDLEHRIPVTGARELADLARAFNTMSSRLQAEAKTTADAQAALEQLNETLEQQVADRTRALEESTAQYRSLVESSPDSILIVQDGRVRFVNRSFAETFGVSETGASESAFDLARIFDPSSATLAADRIAAWERGESPEATEVLGTDAQGRTRHLELRGSRIEYQGRPAAECLLVDMTEAKRLRESLNESEKLRSLGELASGVAHDFNNLLGAILGRAQLLRRRDLAASVDADLAIIEKAARDGRETVRRIQEFSRTRRDKTFEPVDVVEILMDALEITKTRWKDDAFARKAGIKVTTDVGPVPFVLGNPSELREVFTNLVLNAVDAMPQGGKLHVNCRTEGDRVVARVTDSGQGMTEEIRAKLFDPFFTTKGARGTGLGLSVVYGIVTRHDGKITVDTAVGRGTTFAVDLPACPELRLRPAGGDGASLPDRIKPGKILVVDDESAVADVVRDILESAGHAVETVGSGREAMEKMDGGSYDLVFTDLGMPDMSGWEVAERIRETRPAIPVALVTGWGNSLDEAEAKKRGVAAIVHKPFEIDELVRTTQILLAAAARPSAN